MPREKYSAMNEDPSLSRVTFFSSVLEADLEISTAILSENRSRIVSQSEILIGIGIEKGRGNEDVSIVDDGDRVVVARRWIARGGVEGKAVGIAIGERAARIAVEVGSMVFEVEEVVLLEEDIVAAAGDSSACSLLLWGMEALDARFVAGEA
jgi:hypothetical protein